MSSSGGTGRGGGVGDGNWGASNAGRGLEVLSAPFTWLMEFVSADEDGALCVSGLEDAPSMTDWSSARRPSADAG